MYLSEGQKNRFYLIEQVNTGEEIRLRLRGLGLVPDTRLQLLRRKRCGTGIVRARGTRLAVGGRIAGKIRVRELPAGEAGPSGKAARG